MKMTRPERTKFVLENYGQLRVVVPFADFKIYWEARKYGLDYTEQLIRYGRRFMKRKPEVKNVHHAPLSL